MKSWFARGNIVKTKLIRYSFLFSSVLIFLFSVSFFFEKAAWHDKSELFC